MKRTRKIIWVLSLILLFGFFIFVFFGNPIKYYTLKGEFEKFLEEKHDQEFIVGRISFDIMHRTYHSYATPKNDRKLKFYIGQNNITREIDEAYEYEKNRLYESNKGAIPAII
ncbi:hypothetical protein JJQ72_09605 [Paenibacillus sp. F411]|uniref:YfjL-like protein n=1 Tax=Paenibacillus sp. F411 TaxID=2820239 RepID=UPI001AAF3011|nr:hypothetical protein [Paenibacillus sp. F411]MBO2944222.1 hypothetical protein [Paenibacillus sp. F411]